MILLDTNVVSETMRPMPDENVVRWLNRQDANTLFLSAVGVAELLVGVALLPEGRRKTSLVDRIEQGLVPTFAGRILPFDVACSRVYATMIQTTRAAGKAVSVSDAQIAATARARSMMVATRDEAAFRATGVEVVNPWTFAG
jgi:predicted nucleic acid-binding protein